MLLMLPTVGLAAPAEVPSAAPGERESLAAAATQEQICQEFLQTTSDLWFLLSGISNREDADRAADRFLALVHRICLLDERLSSSSTATGLPLEVEEEVEGRDSSQGSELIESLQVRILESFEDINGEFTGICRLRCYGSEKLTHAFVAAGESGIFPDEALAMLNKPTLPLNENESQEELVRIKRLAEPDRALLDTLRSVNDVATASKATGQLAVLTQRLQSLVPPRGLGRRSFDSKSQQRAHAASAPLERMLWDIRTELVRIASLPGYDAAAYDAFSDALNAVYESLGATHCRLFDTVFDASFRSDLDEALNENARTAP